MSGDLFTRTFDRRARTLIATVTLSAIFGLGFGMYSLWGANMETGYEPAQPIPFSHALMAGKHEIDCLYCHGNAVKGAHAGIPTVSECMKCHKEIQTKDEKGELKPSLAMLNDYWAEKKPIEWVKVHDLADFVYFNHSRHMTEQAGLECADCHGPVETMERVRRVHSLKMSWCLDCHKQPAPEGAPAHQETRAPIHCSTCHR